MAAIAPSDYVVLVDLLSTRYTVSQLFDDALAPTGLSSAEFAVYTAIAIAGPSTPQSLGRWTGIPSSTLSALIRRMLQRDHAVRTPNEADGRSYVLSLSTIGASVHADATDRFLTTFDRMTGHLPIAVHEVRVALRLLEGAARAASGRDPGLVRAVARDNVDPGDERSSLTARFRLTMSAPEAARDDELRFGAWFERRHLRTDARSPGPRRAHRRARGR